MSSSPAAAWNTESESACLTSVELKDLNQTLISNSGKGEECETLQDTNKDKYSLISLKTIARQHSVRSAALEVEEIVESPMWRATFNFLIPLFGTGILSLPYTILRGGWVSVGAFLVVPVICIYTAVIMVDCLYDIDPESGRRVRVRSSYQDIGAAVSPKYGRKVVDVVFRVTMLLISSGFLVLAGSFLSSTFPNVAVNKRAWTAIAGAIVLPTLFLKNISQIGWLSMVAFLANIIPIIVTLWYIFRDAVPSRWTIRAIGSGELEGIFISINIVSFSYGFHGILISIENTIAKKSRIYPLVFSCVLFVTCVNVVFALCSFLSFTDSTKDVVTNNLPVGMFLYVANIGIAIKVVCSYALPAFFVVEFFDKSRIKTFCLKKISQTVWFVLVRILVFLMTLAVAVFLPHFGLVIAFTSSFGGSALIFIFPTFFHLKLFKQMSLMKRLCDYVVFVLGLFVAALGIFFSIKEAIYPNSS